MSLLEPAEAAVETPSAPPIGTEAGIGDVAPPQPLRKDVIRRFRRNKLAMFGLVFFVLLVLVAIFAPVVAPYGPTEIPKPVEVRASPSTEHWFGTDNIGRDVFSRVVYGARISLQDRHHRDRDLADHRGRSSARLSGYFAGLTDTRRDAGHRRRCSRSRTSSWRLRSRRCSAAASTPSSSCSASPAGWRSCGSCARTSCRSNSWNMWKPRARSVTTATRIIFRHILPERAPAHHRVRHDRDRWRDPRRSRAGVSSASGCSRRPRRGV